jgi:chemotaxis protein CheX
MTTTEFELGWDSESQLPDGNDLATLVEQVWSSYLDGDIAVLGVSTGSAPSALESENHVVGTVSIHGSWSGHLSLTVSHACAELIAAEMFQLAAETITPSEIVDALGELANILGGNIKAAVPQPSALSLPQVVVDARSLTLYRARHVATAHLEWQGNPIVLSLWDATGTGGSRS